MPEPAFDVPATPSVPHAPPPGPEVQPAQDVTPNVGEPKGASPLAPQSPFDLQQPQQQVYQTGADLIAQKAEADRKAYDERQAQYDPIARILIKKLAAGDNEALANRVLGQMKQVPAPPSIDPQRYQQQALGFVGAMAALGALSSAFTRRSGNASLQAFAGALKGWQTGNLQAYKQKSDEWAQATEQTLANNKVVLDKYKTVLEAKNLDLDEKRSALQLIAAQYQDKLAYNAIAAGNYGMFAALYDKSAAAQDKTVESFLKLNGDKYHETEQYKGRAEVLESPQGQAVLQGLRPEAQLPLQALIKTYGSGAPQMAGGGGPQGSGARNQVFADWKADYIAKNGRPPSPEEEKRELQSLTPVRSLQGLALQRFLDENPKATSAQVVEFAATMQGDIAAIRAAGNRAGQIAVSADEADSTFTLARNASNAFPRYQWMPLNSIYQRWQEASGNPKARKFVAANESAVTAYGATMSRNGANTVAAQQRAHTVLDTADSQQAYAAGLDQLQKEVDAVRKAPARARKDLINSLFPGQADEGADATGNDGWGDLQKN